MSEPWTLIVTAWLNPTPPADSEIDHRAAARNLRRRPEERVFARIP